MVRYLIACIISWCTIPVVVAQVDDCEQILNLATDEFNAGHFYGISAIVKPCIDNGFTREQRQRAYLLLTQVYLLLDDPIGAEESYLKLLQANPEFVAEPNRDPIDVVYLSKKFTASPIFSIYGKLGGNTSWARVIHDWSINNEYKKKDYILKPGWQGGMGFEWHIRDQFSVAIEAMYSFTAYKKDVIGLFQYDNTSIYDRQHWIGFPLLAKYSVLQGKFKPYFYGGYANNFLIGDRASLIITDRTLNAETGSYTQQQRESPTLRFTSRRNSLNRSFLLGGGIRYKWGLDFLFVDARYAFGLSNVVDAKTRYFNYVGGNDNTFDALINTANPIFLYGHVDDDFRLNNLSITFGYVRPLYKARKLKKARTKSVMRDIKKNKKDAS